MDKELSFYRPEDLPRNQLPRTFIDRYVDWAVTATDAPRQYHVINAAIGLSTILCPYLLLHTSYGSIKPNIWSMILAGTTLTRKSTSMDMVKSVLDEAHPDYMLGTEGSPEGLFSELATRNGRASMFHRDEITGWMEAIIRKDYLAGLLESLTRLYDGKMEKRVIRSASIEITDPNLIIMSGGIGTKMAEIITMDHIRSGFLPRFIIVTGTTRAEDQRPIGPPVEISHTHRDPREAVVEELYKIACNYIPASTENKVEIGGITKLIKAPNQQHIMTATPETWQRLQELKFDAAWAGEQSGNPDIYIPLFDRLTNSIIKVAMLLAGSRMSDIIEETDLLCAINYSDDWVRSAMEFASSLENHSDMKDPWEKKAEKVLKFIADNHPKPVTKTDVMRNYRIKAKDIPDLERTLVLRGQIRILETINGGRGRPGKTSYTMSTPDTLPDPDSGTVVRAASGKVRLTLPKRNRKRDGHRGSA